MTTARLSLRTTAASIAAAALLLGGCGGGSGSEADAIARDACELLNEMMAIDFADLDEDGFARMEAMEEEFNALEQRQRDAGLSDEEMEAAFERECPAVFDDF